jgi:hypothetical protein
MLKSNKKNLTALQKSLLFDYFYKNPPIVCLSHELVTTFEIIYVKLIVRINTKWFSNLLAQICGFVVSFLSFETSSRGFFFRRGHARIGLRKDDGYYQDDEVCGYCGN